MKHLRVGAPLESLKRTYVITMMNVIGRSLQALSQVDDSIKKELTGFPNPFLFEMKVLPNGPSLVMRKHDSGHLEYLGGEAPRKPDLTIAFKHLEHAFLVFTFQEGTARSYVNDRMVVDGEVSHGIRMVRCLNRLEVFILPKMIATRAVKRVPPIPVPTKLTHGTHIYGRLVTNLFRGSKHG